jgi:hypothetical protein
MDHEHSSIPSFHKKEQLRNQFNYYCFICKGKGKVQLFFQVNSVSYSSNESVGMVVEAGHSQ